ncbi:phage tail sheath family protein [Tepidimicrobium xylanilyticum]|uniref:Phage tail sheath protein n=1 Tax=Tepidimicrobium xylanilyticum TaxID=1123352 RepID=A0A1H3EW99_9FIRM|nr:phage tail sheath family protein [Tepidimicrobium xylanilyticum]SDX83016.1 Phage tail sheath protein [Tepidimicrobium xylanilyticum]
MALGGGTFTTMNKVLPGAYINFVSIARALGTMGERGIVAMPLEMDWGPEDEVITIDAGEFQKEALNILGYSFADEKMKPLREVFKGASMVKLYRINTGGKKATATVGELTITSKYPGTRGNDIKVVVQANIDDESSFDVITYLGSTQVDIQTVGNIGELKPNNFVEFSGTGALEVTAGVPLTGGENGAATGESYSTFLDKIEAEDFTTLLYAGEDEVTKSLFDSFTKRMRDDEGVKITTVLFDYAKADFEGVISVKNNKELVYWVAGQTAGAAVNESLTNKVYDGEYEVKTKFKKREFEQFIQNGEFAFYQDGNDVRVLKDINTFTSFSPEKNQDFSSNRVIRVLDQIANDTARIFNDFYLGKVTNDDIGRQLFKNELVNYHEQLLNIRAIENFNEEDIIVLPGAQKQDVIVNEVVQPTDAMEKLYMSVQVR